jgi:anti-sigma regulatory factor (Ser/Thr protein kinase)
MSERERARSVNPGPELTLQLPLARASARQLRVALAEHLAARRVPRGATRDVLLAADEAFVNAFMHGGDVEGTVTVRADVHSNRVSVTICDDGCGFDIDALDVRSRPDPQSAHGRGLFLIHHLMDEVEVRSHAAVRGAAGPGTLVRMVKAF